MLIQDWHKDSQGLAKVKTAVEEVLHRELPATYGKCLFRGNDMITPIVLIKQGAHFRPISQKPHHKGKTIYR